MKLDNYTSQKTNYRAKEVIIHATAFVGTQEIVLTHVVSRLISPREQTGDEFIEMLRLAHEIPDVIHIRLDQLTFQKG